jgi:hypothetical protein
VKGVCFITFKPNAADKCAKTQFRERNRANRRLFLRPYRKGNCPGNYIIGNFFIIMGTFHGGNNGRLLKDWKINSILISSNVSRLPIFPIAGSAPSPGVKVEMPLAEKLHSLYLPMLPHPA